jgi:hypothetical protein
MSTRAGLRRRLELLRAAIEPKGSYVRITEPIPEGETPAPVVIGRIGGCDVYGSESSRSILDAALPAGFERQPDGHVAAVKSSETKPV